MIGNIKIEFYCSGTFNFNKSGTAKASCKQNLLRELLLIIIFTKCKNNQFIQSL